MEYYKLSYIHAYVYLSIIIFMLYKLAVLFHL